MKVIYTIFLAVLMQSFLKVNIMIAEETSYKVKMMCFGALESETCKKMIPIKKSILKKYGKQIEIQFYDIWKAENRTKSNEFKVRHIPTQIFFDKKGKELKRFKGFMSEEQIDKFLKSKGLKEIADK